MMTNDPSAKARLAALRSRAKQLEQEEEDLVQRLERVRAEKIRTSTGLLDVERALSSARIGGGKSEETWRRTVRELGTFTPSELAAELGCTNQTAKKHIDDLVEAKILTPAGRVAGKPLYEYVKPTDAGEAFEQQRDRPVIKLPTSEQLVTNDLRSARPHDVRQSKISGVRDKEIRKVVREAMALGWRLEQQGRTGHVFRLVRDTDVVILPSTPRSSGAAADMLRQRLGLRGVRQAS